MKSTFGYWFFAVVITLSALVYQRVTGPTNPKRVAATLNNQTIKNKFPRSGESGTDCKVELKNIPEGWNGSLYYRNYPTNSNWDTVQFAAGESGLIAASLPHRPAAGKLEYFIEFKNSADNSTVDIAKNEPIVIRFKDPVPVWALAPHILLIFIAMLFSNLTGLMAAFNHDRFKFYGVLTIIFLLVAGFIFGPLVQKFAFGAFWTGFPFGYDLTDNKTLIAFVGWTIAVFFNWKTRRPWLSVLAAILMIIVYSIPHSLRGSELSYETGKVVTGFIPYLSNIFHF
ncbi:MAG TPA: hypothetical protein DIW31_09965 [Bacteroidales bacterium]|nr:hypothetical protein [Bacteroidales bacterium]